MAVSPTSPSPPIRVALVGLGSVAQTIHLPTLSLLSHLYTVTAVSDASPAATTSAQKRWNIPLATTSPSTVIHSPDVELVMVLAPDEFHETYVVAALKAGKDVFVEKPLTLSLASAERILAAERNAPTISSFSGRRRPGVFVGYMRRYAPSFVRAFKREISGIAPHEILYARCRGIIGPNEHFISQSGTFPQTFPADDIPYSVRAESKDLLAGLLRETWASSGISGDAGLSDEQVAFTRRLGSLGSHDLSLLRESLGGRLPDSIAGLSAHGAFYSAILNYSSSSSSSSHKDEREGGGEEKEEGGREQKQKREGEGGFSFSATYETGIDPIPRFDSHVAVYGKHKTVHIQYDTPFVKGLPIRVTVDEPGPAPRSGSGSGDGDQGESGMEMGMEMQRREVVSSYEDAYTSELKEVARMVRGGEETKVKVKTSVEDAMDDLRLNEMFYRAWVRQGL